VHSIGGGGGVIDARDDRLGGAVREAAGAWMRIMRCTRTLNTC